jgi:Tfp pilus assembly protein PilN
MDDVRHSRCWFQFSLGNVLLVLTLVALGLVVGQERGRRRQLEAKISQLEAELKAQQARIATLNAVQATLNGLAARHPERLGLGNQPGASAPEQDGPFRVLEPYREP